MREIKPRTTRKVSSREHQQRLATEKKYMEKHKSKLDAHDVLHSIFWGMPTRDALRPVWDKLGRELVSSRVDSMRAEINEVIEMGMGTHYR